VELRPWADRFLKWKILKKGLWKLRPKSNCLAWALIIAIVRVENDSNYKLYVDGWKYAL